MKCLSVSQPYADLITSGRKTVELRTWNTKFRGEFLIHAPIEIKTDACERLGIDITRLQVGVILGKAEIYDVKKYQTIDELKVDSEKHFGSLKFFEPKYGFLLRNPIALRVPIPYKGKLGFFEVKIENKPTKNQIKSEIFDEEYRYQWIGKH